MISKKNNSKMKRRLHKVNRFDFYKYWADKIIFTYITNFYENLIKIKELVD